MGVIEFDNEEEFDDYIERMESAQFEYIALKEAVEEAKKELKYAEEELENFKDDNKEFLVGGVYIAGKFQDDDACSRYWNGPYYKRWGKFQSLSWLWTSKAFESRIREATRAEIKKLLKMIKATK